MREENDSYSDSRMSLDYEHKGSYCLSPFDVRVYRSFSGFPEKDGYCQWATAKELNVPQLEDFKKAVMEYYGNEVLSKLSFEDESFLEIKDN